jgi:anti-anti-sigma factor
LRYEETDMALRLAVNREDPRDRAGHAEAMQAAAAAEFRVDVARERGTVRISPVGELDVATIGHVREHLGEAMTSGAGRVILDLRDTTFLDSSGLHLAVETHDWATRNGAEFAIVPGPPAVQRAFDATGLSARLPFVDVPRA